MTATTTMIASAAAAASSGAASGSSASSSASSSGSSASSTCLTPAQVEDVRDIFRHLDRHALGTLNVAQVTQALHMMGVEHMTEMEVQDMISEIDVGQNAGKGLCTFDVFLVLCARDFATPSNATPLPPSLRDALVRAYHTLDWDKDGTISADDLMRAFHSIGENKYDATIIRDMIQEVDSTGSGTISKEDFLNIMSPS